MKRKSWIQKFFVAAFVVVLLFSANSVFAQCGNYFKTNYRAINKHVTVSIPEVGLDDWTGDGRSDFWNLRRHSSDLLLDVVIYPSLPAGYWDFDNPIVYTTPNQSIGGDVKVLDFNADGRRDLLYGAPGTFQFLRNNGNGTMTPSPIFTDTDGSLGSTSHIGFADFNGDNLLDWIYIIFVNSVVQIRYQLQNPDGTFGNKTTVLAATPQNFLQSSNKRLGDFNGDGKIDIIYSTIANNQNIYVMIKNLGGGNFEASAPVATDLYVYIAPIYNNSVRDFNNDGRDDILSRGAIFYGQADATFNRVPMSGTSDFLLTAELNGDNNLDVMEIGSGFYATHTNNGAGGFTRTVYQKSFDRSAGGVVRFEDFNADGKDDVYESRIFNANYPYNIFGERIMSVRENICNSFGETRMANFDANTNFDGTTNADVMMWNPDTGNWSLKNAKWYPNVDPNTRVFNWGSGSHGDVPAPGDFDGDGKTDYSVYRNSTGVWYIFRSSDSSWMTFPFGLPGDIAVPNDYNGGGTTDIALFRPSDGNWYIWFSETQQFLAGHFGAAGDRAVPADYDGDGKTDIAVYRPSEGNWYYLKSTDGNYVVTHWGIETDKPVPADYDGDGKADLTIWRDGIWWLLRSSNNSTVAVPWGTAGDIPIPVYRNSVSADMTFYRPSNNTWYSFYDTSFFQGFPMGGNGDVPVYFGLPNN